LKKIFQFVRRWRLQTFADLAEFPFFFFPYLFRIRILETIFNTFGFSLENKNKFLNIFMLQTIEM